MDNYGRPTREDEITILYAPPRLIESGQRVMKKMYEEQMEEERAEKSKRNWLELFGMKSR